MKDYNMIMSPEQLSIDELVQLIIQEELGWPKAQLPEPRKPLNKPR
jgi:hypothetical protein